MNHVFTHKTRQEVSGHVNGGVGKIVDFENSKELTPGIPSALPHLVYHVAFNA